MWYTIPMKPDYEIVRTVNSCLNLLRLSRLLADKEWNRFIALLEGGQLCFSGDATGFHIDDGSICTDCASPETTLMPDVFSPKTMKDLQSR